MQQWRRMHPRRVGAFPLFLASELSVVEGTTSYLAAPFLFSKSASRRVERSFLFRQALDANELTYDDAGVEAASERMMWLIVCISGAFGIARLCGGRGVAQGEQGYY